MKNENLPVKVKVERVTLPGLTQAVLNAHIQTLVNILKIL